MNASLQLLAIVPAFALTALLLAMVPGQGVAMVLRQSLVGGKRAAFFSVFGNSSGLIVWGTLSSIGLSAIFAKSHTAFNVLKYVGVAFLLGLAVQTLIQLKNEFGKFDVDSGAKTKAGATALIISGVSRIASPKFSSDNVSLFATFHSPCCPPITAWSKVHALKLNLPFA